MDGKIVMGYDPKIHHRRSVRLEGYDYSQEGCYFITVCTQRQRCLFGEIENSRMILNDAGKIIENQWKNLPSRFAHIGLNEYVVMPNHFHGIIKIVGATLVVAQNANDLTPTRRQDHFSLCKRCKL